MSEQQTQTPTQAASEAETAAAVPEPKRKMTKEERIEFQNKKREEKKAAREARKAAKREELEKNTVEITRDEFLKFKEWKRSIAKVRVNKEQYEAYIAANTQAK